jgi:hypothetical protein
METFVKWKKSQARWKYAWIINANPFSVGWYNARINYKLDEDPEFGFYFDGCKDSLWRYWNGKSWSVACSQKHTQAEVQERLKEFCWKTKPKDIAWNSEYPNYIGVYKKYKGAK